MDIKDIESGTSHIANEVLLLLCNDRKWHDSWVDYVAFIKTSDFYDRWPHTRRLRLSTWNCGIRSCLLRCLAENQSI